MEAQRPRQNNQEDIEKLNDGRNLTLKRKFQSMQTQEPEINYISLISYELDTCFSFDEQVASLIEQTKETNEERQKIEEILEDVKEVFDTIVPGVQPALFGSRLTGLAFKGSDLDILLLCPGGQPTYNFVQKKGRVMYKSSKFRKVVRIARARVPLIKAEHVATGLNLDISCSSPIALYNSRLLSHLMSVSQPKFRSLLMAVLFWAKSSNLVRPGQLSSYTIIVLMVFYMQQIEPAILPPLKDLVRTKEGEKLPSYFLDDPSLLASSNSTPLSDLFLGFFEYYKDFDFATQVVSTYYGKPIPTEWFKTDPLKNLPDCFTDKEALIGPNGFSVDKAIHIQEVYNLSLNCTRGIDQKVVAIMKELFSLTATVLHGVPVNGWLKLVLDSIKMPRSHILEFKGTCGITEKPKLSEVLRLILEYVCRLEVVDLNPYEGDSAIVFSISGQGLTFHRNRPSKHLRHLPLTPLQLEIINSSFVRLNFKESFTFSAILFVTKSGPDLQVRLLDVNDYKSNVFKQTGVFLKATLFQYLEMGCSEPDLAKSLSDAKSFVPVYSNNALPNVVVFAQLVTEAYEALKGKLPPEAKIISTANDESADDSANDLSQIEGDQS